MPRMQGDIMSANLKINLDKSKPTIKRSYKLVARSATDILLSIYDDGVVYDASDLTCTLIVANKELTWEKAINGVFVEDNVLRISIGDDDLDLSGNHNYEIRVFEYGAQFINQYGELSVIQNANGSGGLPEPSNGLDWSVYTFMLGVLEHGPYNFSGFDTNVESDGRVTVTFDDSEIVGDIEQLEIDLNAHIDNTNNPHNVTPEQIGLGDVEQDIQQLQTEIESSDFSDPLPTLSEATGKLVRYQTNGPYINASSFWARGIPGVNSSIPGDIYFSSGEADSFTKPGQSIVAAAFYEDERVLTLPDKDGTIAINEDLESHINDTNNPHNVTTEQINAENVSNKGANNGYAPLDAGGKIPAANLPNTIMEFKGTWDAEINVPTLEDGVGTNGDVYVAISSGTQNFGSGLISFSAGDWVVYNGSIWQKSINSNAVVSVNGQQGVVVLDADDVDAVDKTTNQTIAGEKTFSDDTIFDAPLRNDDGSNYLDLNDGLFNVTSGDNTSYIEPGQITSIGSTRIVQLEPNFPDEIIAIRNNNFNLIWKVDGDGNIFMLGGNIDFGGGSILNATNLLEDAPSDGKQYARQDGDWGEINDVVLISPNGTKFQLGVTNEGNLTTTEIV